MAIRPTRKKPNRGNERDKTPHLRGTSTPRSSLLLAGSTGPSRVTNTPPIETGTAVHQRRSEVVQAFLEGGDEVFCVLYPAGYPYKAVRDANLQAGPRRSGGTGRMGTARWGGMDKMGWDG